MISAMCCGRPKATTIFSVVCCAVAILTAATNNCLVHVAAASDHYGGSGSSVQVLDAAGFRKMKNSGMPFLVKFWSPGCPHCTRMITDYEKAAASLKDIVKVVAVEDQSVGGEEDIKGYPTVKFIAGLQTNVTHTGERTASAIATFAASQISILVKKRVSGGDAGKESKSSGKGHESTKDSKVISLSDGDFEKTLKASPDDAWLVLFYAPWCGHCKSMMGDWAKTAATLAGKVKVAQVDATKNSMVATHFELKGFPTIKLFPPFTERKWNSLAQVAVPYEGARTAGAFVEFGLQYAGKAIQVKQMTSQDQFTEECAKGVCVVSFLPHIMDSNAKERNEALQILNGVMRASFSMPVKFLWSEGGEQFKFEEELRLQFGFPAVLAFNMERKRFAIYKGAFQTEALRSFITGLMSGHQSIDPLPEPMPQIKTVEPWDGKDAPLQVSSEGDEL